MAAYDPRCAQSMALAYATSNRGACHLRGYTPSAEILGIPEKHDPHEWRGKGELVALFQDMHAISDSFDICKFNAFAEGIEEYVLQYNGMTGRDVTEEELLETGERVYNVERYYNNLAGFDGSDDDLPDRFVEGDEHAMPAQGGSEGELAELSKMKDEYYEVRGWENGVVHDEKLDDGNDSARNRRRSGGERHRATTEKRRPSTVHSLMPTTLRLLRISSRVPTPATALTSPTSPTRARRTAHKNRFGRRGGRHSPPGDGRVINVFRDLHADDWSASTSRRP